MRLTAQFGSKKIRKPSHVSTPTFTIPRTIVDWLATFLAIAVANLRPTAIGGTYSFVVCAFIVFCISIFYFCNGSAREKLSLHKNVARQLFLLIALNFYLLIRVNLMSGTLPEDSFKGFLIMWVVISTLFLVSSCRSMTRPFFDSFAIIIILSSLSLIVTFSLVASGVPLYALKIAHLDLTGYDYLQNYGDVSFPFTFIANDANSWFGFVPRSGGLFREPGVFPPFACWAAAYAYLRKWSLPWIAVCLLASVLSLSTVGPLAFFTGAILLAYKFRIRPIRALILIALLGAALWPALYSMEFIGLEDKIASQSGSFADRQVLFWGAFDVKNIMFGDGFGWGGVSSTEGISLVSQMRVYGVIYVVTVVAIYICAMKNIKLWIAGCLPGFITVLFSQPISTDAAFLVIFFSWAAFQETSPRDTGSKMHPGSSRRLMPFCLPTN